MRRASPWGALSSSRASPAVRAKAVVTASMAWGAWRMRIWVAALETTARPRSLARTSAASWVTTVRPAAAFAGGLGHPEQELGALAVAQQEPRLVDHDQPPLTSTRRQTGRQARRG